MLIVSLNPQICSPSFVFVLAHGCTIHPGVEASHLAIVFDFTLSHRPNISRPLSILSTLPPRYFLNLATVFYLVIIVSSKLTHDYKFPCFLCLVPVIFVAEKFMKKNSVHRSYILPSVPPFYSPHFKQLSWTLKKWFLQEMFHLYISKYKGADYKAIGR